MPRFAFVALALALVCRTAAATVTEPNGLVVPATVNNGETTLQQYFTSVNENIDAVKNASIVPATFLPLCDFQATLVLSQSQAAGGLAWYNVPTSATATPTVYLINPFPMTVGQIISSANIRTDPNYAGGLVGFALMKNLGNGPVPVYYSEDMRNVDCTGCSMPGYWEMMLSYASTLTSNEYYMAWEDWEGANSTSWPDDGDFNDKVFAITGVTCNGGGVPCQTTKMGVCANGITQCVVGGSPTCVQEIQPSPEKCDNLDNDCNGIVDDGTGLCPGDEVCVQGQCISPCSPTEFPCGPPLVCVNGLCVDPTCENVTCQPGQLCQNGACVGGCDGVVCPANQICELGVCVDPCQGVTCNGTVCVLGVCVQNCSCAPCPSGQVCAATGASAGACVDTGCDSITCNTAAGEVCSKGACMDACTGAQCPGGAGCHNGQCDPPPPPGSGGATGSGGASATSGAGGMVVTTTGAGGSGKGGSGGATGTGGTLSTGSGGAASGGAGGSAHQEGGVVSCSCETGGGGSGQLALVALLAVAGATLARRRRTRR